MVSEIINEDLEEKINYPDRRWSCHSTYIIE